MTTTPPPNSPNIREIVERLERAPECGSDKLDQECAVALGWHERRVTRLGLNGRTPGSYLWFPPNYPRGYAGRRKPPRLSGPRKRTSTIAALKSQEHPDA